MKLDHFICTSSQAKSCDFSKAKLKSANFSKTDLSETNFNNADCEKASFSDAKEYYIDPSITKLKDAVFSFPEALSLLHSFEIKIDNF
jgi:fluoroquinolone resistance protein